MSNARLATALPHDHGVDPGGDVRRRGSRRTGWRARSPRVVPAPFGDLLVSLLGFLVIQVTRPIFWLVDRLGIDPEAVRRAFARLQANAARARHRTAEHAGGPSFLGRMLGLALFVAAAWALIRFLRRLRPETVTAGRRSSQALVTAMSGELSAPPDDGSRATRTEPPADRVRRWYGEVLVALAQRGVRKDPSFTPAEFGPAW